MSEPKEEPTSAKSSPLDTTFALVRRAQGGDRIALEALTERYYGRLGRIVRVRIGPQLRRHLETGDILAESFAKAIQIFDRFEMRDEGSLLRWLGQIAERKIRDANDKLHAQKRAEPRQPPGGARPNVDDATVKSTFQPPELVADAEQVQRLEAAMDTLRAEQRELILAHDFEGLGWSEVAEACKLTSPDAARMAYGRAMAALAVALQRLDGPRKRND
ncbi:MAG: sigma-70 family RNA polymerase sigma factor [Planctomycetota bacterium]